MSGKDFGRINIEPDRFESVETVYDFVTSYKSPRHFSYQNVKYMALPYSSLYGLEYI